MIISTPRIRTAQMRNLRIEVPVLLLPSLRYAIELDGALVWFFYGLNTIYLYRMLFHFIRDVIL